MLVQSKPYRTIWPHPELREVVQIIDQRLLPHEFVIVDLRTVEDFARAIKEMYVRGAGLIGATAGFGMYAAALHSRDDHFDQDMRDFAATLVATRPTARNLAWAVERQLAALKDLSSPAAKRTRSFAVACEIADEDAAFCKEIGRHGVEIIREISRRKGGAPVNILTHCNAGWLAFVDYGSATAPIYEAQAQGIDIHVWVDETRPWLQGARLTTWELKEQGVPHTLIADNTGGHLMQHGLVDLVLVGTDRTTSCGDVANKIGTYLKALAAFDNKVPFYVALPSSTFDWQLCDGVKDIPIEERSGNEVNQVTGLSAAGLTTVTISPSQTRAANYSFDVTPARLVTGLITERGITKADKESILALYPEKS
ncbi:MAG: S-methyl-5-thioribose-1-phosphate isomerase [Desulfurivibrionaceae bacterium]|nr:S-methyl-5-thioribose-1-phosphate isomerase [Desulfurivibrionaceae bacterium]